MLFIEPKLWNPDSILVCFGRMTGKPEVTRPVRRFVKGKPFAAVHSLIR